MLFKIFLVSGILVNLLPYLVGDLYQDPAEADKLLKIQRDLDETKIILVNFTSLTFHMN